ncbi:PTDSS2 [Branchiostoma lanceolatum]|uniref:Phosphatidylserine synthase n=1 Tax=Branchiostoma lanceolatum TaxID=7740 RepID=A0A8J9ZJP4_BRALA|nr:PTDSS2 [Branchiostoma lanceolatum]
MHRVGRSDQSGRVGHNPRRGTNRDAVPSDNDDPLPFEFLLRKKLEWRVDNKVVDGDGRTKYFRFVGISVMMFLVCAAPFAPSGPFEWPHPVFWRLVTCVAVGYQMGLTLLYFQTAADDSRQLLKYLDESLGEPLSTKPYADNCTLWDAEHPERVMYKLWVYCDLYGALHFLDHYFTALAVRDYWMVHVVSVMWELIEYSVEHQIPFLEECWWDHWIVDVAVCNSLGIWCGMKTLEYLDLRLYDWRGLWNVPVYPSKRKTIAGQLGSPDWSRTRRFKRCLAVLAYMTSLLILGLNSFYLQSVLWIPIRHWLQLARLTLWLIEGAAVSRQVYQYMDDPNCKSLGHFGWIYIILVITEVAIIVKFGRDLLLIPFPDHILISWIAGFLALTSWFGWRFFIE